MKDQLEKIYREHSESIQTAEDLKQLDELRIRVLGRKGQLTEVLHGLKSLPPEERRNVGQMANTIKQQLVQEIDKRMQVLKEASWSADLSLRPDPTLPGRPNETGRFHILNRTLGEIRMIFQNLGFSVAEGPEIETDYYNFSAMNFPADHPSRDEHDTLFVSEDVLLRTHTSPVQVRYMEKHKPPIRVIIPGKTYRNDDDASHSPMFHQVEGLMVGEDITFSNLKAVLTLFVHQIFDKDVKVRFRPGFFPFTEPSAEMDISCVKCRGKGCSLCKGTGWMEILGAGMVHPNVLKSGGVDPEKYTGFAFGTGVERVTMLKYGLDSIRHLYENDLRFLQQF